MSTMETKMQSFIARNISMKIHPFSGDFLVSFKDPRQLLTDNWFAVVLEVVSAFILFQVFRHAKKTSTQSTYLLLAAIFSTLFFEVLPVIPREGYQLWWYHQGLVNFLKQRVPSFVISTFALVHYMANRLTSRSNLPNLTRSTLTALCATLIMFPCLWLAPRLLLIVFHLDDPIFNDKFLGVPYIEILVVFLLFFHTSHLFHQNYISIESQERNTYSYVKCAVQTGLVSAMYSIVEQYLLYILITLTIRANTGFCLIAAIMILMFLSRNELAEKEMTSYSIQGMSTELGTHLDLNSFIGEVDNYTIIIILNLAPIFHICFCPDITIFCIISPLLRKELWAVVVAMLFTSTLPLWVDTHSLRSSSERLELGPCHIMHEVMNTSPLLVPRRRYICPDDETRMNFDFHCLSEKELADAMNNKTSYYPICGKNIDSPTEVSKVLSFYSLFCMALFYSLMRFSFNFKVQEEAVLEAVKKIE